MVSAGSALAVSAILFWQLPTITPLSLWRPTEIFGPSFVFSLDQQTWPFLALGATVVFAEAVLGARSGVRLAYSGIALAAIAGGNLLTIAMFWSIMIVMESALRISDHARPSAGLQEAGVQFAAVAFLVAAAYFESASATLIAAAALTRSAGGAYRGHPFSLAVLAPLGALVTLSRMGSALPIAAGLLMLAIVAYVLFFKSNFTLFAISLAAAGLMAPGETQALVLITLAGILVATIGLRQLKTSRYAWGVSALVPAAFFGVVEPWITASVSAAGIGVTSLQLGDEGVPLQNKRRETVSAGLLVAAAVSVALLSGWLPNLGGLIVGAIGLLIAYGLTRAYPTLAALKLPSTDRFRRGGSELLRLFAGSVRTVADVFEGESAVLWILLILLILLIGLRTVTL